MASTPFDEAKLSSLERRQYQRLYFDFQQGDLKKILGAEIIWSDGSEAEVFDMSYSGAASKLVKKLKLKAGQTYPVKVRLGEEQVGEIPAEVMWIKEPLIGLRWGEMPGKARLCFARFLGDKLIGANLTAIHPQFFSSNTSFDHWFHGPLDTNVYLWMSRQEDGRPQSEIERAIIELDDELMVYEFGTLSRVKRSPEWDIQRDYGDLEDWVVNWEPVGKDSNFLRRTLHILSQVSDLKAPLQSLVEELHFRTEGGNG